MSIFKTLCFVTFAAWSCFPSPAVWAQQFDAHAYEEGVNAYFAGRAGQAEMFLSSAIEVNSQDPRAYYFRALSLLCQGRIDEARGDMQTGALLEAQQPHRFAIGSALERIQGPKRLMLEEFRRNARQNVVSELAPGANAPATNQTYRQGEAEVLRQKSVVPLEELLRPGGPHAIPDEPAAEKLPLPPQGNSPVASPSAATPPEQPATKPAAAGPNPFADDADHPAPTPPAPVPKIPPQTAPKPTPPANPPAVPDDNPFGG